MWLSWLISCLVSWLWTCVVATGVVGCMGVIGWAGSRLVGTGSERVQQQQQQQHAIAPSLAQIVHGAETASDRSGHGSSNENKSGGIGVSSLSQSAVARRRLGRFSAAASAPHQTAATSTTSSSVNATLASDLAESMPISSISSVPSPPCSSPATTVLQPTRPFASLIHPEVIADYAARELHRSQGYLLSNAQASTDARSCVHTRSLAHQLVQMTREQQEQQQQQQQRDHMSSVTPVPLEHFHTLDADAVALVSSLSATLSRASTLISQSHIQHLLREAKLDCEGDLTLIADQVREIDEHFTARILSAKEALEAVIAQVIVEQEAAVRRLMEEERVQRELAAQERALREEEMQRAKQERLLSQQRKLDELKKQQNQLVQQKEQLEVQRRAEKEASAVAAKAAEAAHAVEMASAERAAKEAAARPPPAAAARTPVVPAATPAAASSVSAASASAFAQAPAHAPVPASAQAPAPASAPARAPASAPGRALADGKVVRSATHAAKLAENDRAMADFPKAGAVRVNVLRTVTSTCNQISASLNVVATKSEQLLEVLHRDLPPAGKAWARDLVATKLLASVEARIVNAPSLVFPIALVIDNVSREQPVVLDLFMAKLEQKFVFVSAAIPQRAQFATEHAYRKAMGYEMTPVQGGAPNEVTIESEQLYVARMRAYVSLFAALLEVQSMRTQGCAPAWIWLAQIVNAPLHLITSTLITNFINVIAYRFAQCYPRQLVKMLRLIQDQVHPRLVELLDAHEAAGAGQAGQLETYRTECTSLQNWTFTALETLQRTGTLRREKKEGFDLPEDQSSSSQFQVVHHGDQRGDS